ncbi:MAG TPA: putative toxin-antitoxin system toxin component, PIN family [Burkholderiaceae bacterium]|nr:putative toxin-antitoxin system toxin component, PIN family [Burkholderiaceae bacterium]
MTARNAPRVVIDTNAVLDWLVFREASALALGDAVERGRWTWCATHAMLNELRSVLARPLADRWEQAQKLALTIDIEALATLCEAKAPAPRDALVCRDPADQMFIDLALGRTPCWLVTRDKALLALRRRAAARGVVIVPVESWHREHAAPRAAAPGDVA